MVEEVADARCAPIIHHLNDRLTRENRKLLRADDVRYLSSWLVRLFDWARPSLSLLALPEQQKARGNG